MESKEYQEAREAIKNEILRKYWVTPQLGFDIADTILNLKWEDGSQMIGVLSRDQKVPSNPYSEARFIPPVSQFDKGIWKLKSGAQPFPNSYYLDLRPQNMEYSYNEAQQDMLKMGFKKVVSK